MSSKKTTHVEPAVAAEVFNQLATRGDAPLSYEEAFDILDNTPDEQLQTLTSSYFNFDEYRGKSVTLVFEGMSQTTMDGKLVDVVKLRDRQGIQYINGDSVLVTSCRNLTTTPCWIKVTYAGDKKSSKGTYKDLTVKTFPIAF